MSLYDNWEAKKLPDQSEPAATPRTNVWQTTEGSQTCSHLVSYLKKKKNNFVFDPFFKCVLPYSPTAAQNLPREPEREQRLAAGPSLLAESEFPALGLGANMSLTKEQKSKVRDTNQREASAPVFKKAYHAQLREVHGGNMRAVEAMEEDDEEETGRRRNRSMDKDMVNSLMQSVIREIAEEGELVTKEKVRKSKMRKRVEGKKDCDLKGTLI